MSAAIFYAELAKRLAAPPKALPFPPKLTESFLQNVKLIESEMAKAAGIIVEQKIERDYEFKSSKVWVDDEPTHCKECGTRIISEDGWHLSHTYGDCDRIRAVKRGTEYGTRQRGISNRLALFESFAQEVRRRGGTVWKDPMTGNVSVMSPGGTVRVFTLDMILNAATSIYGML